MGVAATMVEGLYGSTATCGELEKKADSNNLNWYGDCMPGMPVAGSEAMPP